MKVGIVNARKMYGANWLQCVRPVTTIHDELILEVDRFRDDKDDIKQTLETAMTTMPESWGLKVPLVAEAKFGTTWKDIK